MRDATPTLLLLTTLAVAEGQDWFHVKQTIAPDGDYTDKERKELMSWDPGINDSPTAIKSPHGDAFLKALLKDGAKPYANQVIMEPEQWSEEVGVKVTDAKVKNVGGTETVMTEQGLQPAMQYDYYAGYGLEDRPRRVALLTMDLVEDYRGFVGYLVDKVAALQKAFRDKDLPVFTSNWIRRPDDGLYGALDRFYGTTGVKEAYNPMYIYSEGGAKPMTEIAPTKEEFATGKVIKSMHLSKFADLDKDGRSTFWKKLKALSIDTLVIVGAWYAPRIAAQPIL